MHRLRSTSVSLDSSVIVDFHLTGNLSLLETLFHGRMLISDLVGKELSDASIRITSAETIVLSADEEWKFFKELREGKPGLGSGELGAITVAHFRRATLLTNDRQARLAGEQMGLGVAGAIGVLERGVEMGNLSGKDAVKILEDMIREGAWIADELLEMFRQRILQED